MKTAVSNRFKSMFLCCNPEEARGRASFDDVKIDSEISEIAGALKDKMVAEKTVKCDTVNQKKVSSSTNIKRASSKFLSPGMVKMTIARNKKCLNRSEEESKQGKDDTEEIISAYNESEQGDMTNLEAQSTNKKSSSNQFNLYPDNTNKMSNLMTESKPENSETFYDSKPSTKEVVENKVADVMTLQSQNGIENIHLKSDNDLKTNVNLRSDNDLRSNVNLKSDNNLKSNVNLKTNVNLRLDNHLKLSDNSSKLNLERRNAMSSFENRPESSFKNISQVDIKSIENYLQQDSLCSESVVSEDEPEISCAIDFYDKKEFNRMLLKKIQQSLKKERKDIRYRKDKTR